MVLCYHEIFTQPTPYRYGVTDAAFSGHLQAIKAIGSTESSQSRVQVTFDDGHKSQFEHALPILEAAAIRGLFFVTAGWTDRQANYMTSAQLRDLRQLGHDVQAHGWSHKMLTLCSPSELYEELKQGKERLENHLGALVDGISMPHGRWNQRVLETCLDLGYRRVYTSNPRQQPKQSSGLQLTGRLMVTKNMTAQSIGRLLNRGPSRLDVSQAKEVLKGGMRSVLGEKRYHRLWKSVAARKTSFAKLPPTGNPRRILHLISSNGFYGAEAVVLNLTSELERLGCHSTIAVFRNEQSPHTELADRARQLGLRSEIIPCRGRLDPGAIRQIRRLLFSRGIDVVHTHGFKSDIYGSMAVGRTGVPLLATHHSNWPQKGSLLHFYHLIDRLTLKRFRKVVAVSDEINHSLERSGIGRGKLETIYNGIDTSPFQEASLAGNPAVLGTPPSPKIGLVARLIPGKGHALLLEASRQILQEHPSAIFIFVGAGPLETALREQVLAAGLSDKVTFAGVRSDMPDVYASLDVVILPSAAEGTPMTLLEALAARKPVVASRVGGIPELISDGETGLLIEPGDADGLACAINRLLSDSKLRSVLASEGQRRVSERFSARAMAQSYLLAYEEMLSNSRETLSSLQNMQKAELL